MLRWGWGRRLDARTIPKIPRGFADFGGVRPRDGKDDRDADDEGDAEARGDSEVGDRWRLDGVAGDNSYSIYVTAKRALCRIREVAEDTPTACVGIDLKERSTIEG